MKEDILRILNRERNESEGKAEEAKRNNDLVNLLVYRRFTELLERLIKTIQENG